MSVSVRKQMLDLVKRRVKPGNGSIHKEWREKQMTKPLLQEWAILAEQLSSIDYAVAGGMAVGVYSPERATQDIDLVIVSLKAIEDCFEKLGYSRVGTLSIGGTTWKMKDGREIDVLDISDRPWAEKALKETYAIYGFPVIPLPYLILMKLEASRLQDIADISRMVKYADEESRSKIREVVKRYRPEDLDDLEQIIQIEDYTSN